MILALLDTTSTGYCSVVDAQPQTAHYYISAYDTACTYYDRPRSAEFIKAMRREWLDFTRGDGWTTESRLRGVRVCRPLLRQRVTPHARMVRRVSGARRWRSMKTIRRQERRAMQPLG